MKYTILALTLLVAGCTHPGLTGQALTLARADQTVVAIGTAWHAAQALNGVQVCEPAPCHPLFSDANTRIVGDAATDALTTLKATPDGWKAIALTACDRIDARLDALGKSQFKAYVQAVRAVIGGL